MPVSKKLLPAEDFFEAKKWSAALVFLSQLAKQTKDRFLYFQVMSWYVWLLNSLFRWSSVFILTRRERRFTIIDIKK